MFSKIAYPIFGFVVLFVYAATTFSGSDMRASSARHTRLPAQYLGGAYRNAPIVWRSSFHGPGPAPVRKTSTTSRRSGYSGGGYYGGFGGGK